MPFLSRRGRIPHVPGWLDIPLFVLSGEKDGWTPSQGCLWHEAVVKGAPCEVEIDEDAHHSFDLPMPVQYCVGHTVGGIRLPQPIHGRR